MAKFGFNDILNAKSKAAGAGAVTDYTEIWLNPHDVKPSENNFYSQENIEELMRIQKLIFHELKDYIVCFIPCLHRFFILRVVFK